MQEQASYLSTTLFQEAKARFSCNSELGNSKQTGGEIIFLRKLFEGFFGQHLLHMDTHFFDFMVEWTWVFFRTLL